MIKFDFKFSWKTCIPGKRFNTHVVCLNVSLNYGYLLQTKLAQLCFILDFDMTYAVRSADFLKPSNY